MIYSKLLSLTISLILRTYCLDDYLNIAIKRACLKHYSRPSSHLLGTFVDQQIRSQAAKRPGASTRTWYFQYHKLHHRALPFSTTSRTTGPYHSSGLSTTVIADSLVDPESTSLLDPPPLAKVRAILDRAVNEAEPGLCIPVLCYAIQQRREAESVSKRSKNWSRARLISCSFTAGTIITTALWWGYTFTHPCKQQTTSVS